MVSKIKAPDSYTFDLGSLDFNQQQPEVTYDSLKKSYGNIRKMLADTINTNFSPEEQVGALKETTQAFNGQLDDFLKTMDRFYEKTLEHSGNTLGGMDKVKDMLADANGKLFALNLYLETESLPHSATAALNECSGEMFDILASATNSAAYHESTFNRSNRKFSYHK